MHDFLRLWRVQNALNGDGKQHPAGLCSLRDVACMVWSMASLFRDANYIIVRSRRRCGTEAGVDRVEHIAKRRDGGGHAE